MSSAYNHMKRSHRSEKHKASAFRGFRPQSSPNRNKYTNKAHFFSRGAIMRWLAQRNAKRKAEKDAVILEEV